MSQFQCPLCGKYVSVRHYDPSEFEDDIILVQVRGLGRGKGVEVVETFSLLEGDDPYLLDLLSDRIAILYDLLFEDNGDDDDSEKDEVVDDDGDIDGTAAEGEAGEKNCELLELVNDVLANIYEEPFSDLGEAVEALVEEYLIK